MRGTHHAEMAELRSKLEALASEKAEAEQQYQDAQKALAEAGLAAGASREAIDEINRLRASLEIVQAERDDLSARMEEASEAVQRERRRRRARPSCIA